MSARPSKVFISDLHGQGEMFDALLEQRFGLLEAVLCEHVSKNPKAPIAALRHYLLNETLASLDSSDHFIHLTAMMEVLLSFKHDRRFWPVGVEVFASCSWFLNIIDEYAITGKLDEQRREAIALLDDQDRDQLCRYIAKAVKSLISYRLHVVGDIYDRGPGAAHILDLLEVLPAVNVQWGNHDVLWMGAASGSLACIATVVRLCLKYGDTSTLTEDYGISLEGLSEFSQSCYSNSNTRCFATEENNSALLPWDKMHKAIAIIQFKLEEQIIERNPNFAMADRAVLQHIDFFQGTFSSNGLIAELVDTDFPTIDKDSTSALTEAEWLVIEALKQQFIGSERLQKHVNFLFANGSLLASDDQFTLFHGCCPVDDGLEPAAFTVNNRALKGRALFDALELQLRKAYSRRNSLSCQYLSDIAWYLWCGPKSPLFGRQKMTTFERYFIADKAFHQEGKNPYFDARDDEAFIQSIALELSGNRHSVLVNGHVPVKLRRGEPPKRANGKLYCIDGGFAQAYRNTTGAAGMVMLEHGSNIYLFKVAESNNQVCFQQLELTRSNAVGEVK
ncbi:fructose-bisphosphatase class III [Gilvimarinus chinensis]|uniref:fructose-bisphosphatase class III n=1 Tax=Gilvimarinus chinensis TaxID=396005 RepID=UPI0006865F34|nr:fructose-bisphosphatase class III [Gilvimarinus chinensis]